MATAVRSVASSQGGDLVGGREPLEPGDDRDVAGIEGFEDALGPDLDDPGLTVRRVGDDPACEAGVAGGAASPSVDRDAKERHRDAFARREEHVHLEGRRLGAMSLAMRARSSVVCPIAETTTIASLPASRASGPVGNDAEPIDAVDRGPAVFLHDDGHGASVAVRLRATGQAGWTASTSSTSPAPRAGTAPGAGAGSRDGLLGGHVRDAGERDDRMGSPGLGERAGHAQRVGDEDVVVGQAVDRGQRPREVRRVLDQRIPSIGIRLLLRMSQVALGVGGVVEVWSVTGAPATAAWNVGATEHCAPRREVAAERRRGRGGRGPGTRSAPPPPGARPPGHRAPARRVAVDGVLPRDPAAGRSPPVGHEDAKPWCEPLGLEHRPVGVEDLREVRAPPRMRWPGGGDGGSILPA